MCLGLIMARSPSLRVQGECRARIAETRTSTLRTRSPIARTAARQSKDPNGPMEARRGTGLGSDLMTRWRRAVYGMASSRLGQAEAFFAMAVNPTSKCTGAILKSGVPVLPP